MICFSKDELRGYLLQEIAAEKQTLVEQHIGSCTVCRRTLDALAGDDLVRDYFEAFQRDDQSVSEAPSCSEIRSTTLRRDLDDWQPFIGDESRLPIRFARFLLKEVLGAGGFGIVYRAEDIDLEREVAVKIPHLGRLSPEVRQRFLREGAAAATLHHPHIVQVHQSGTHRGICFLVSEYCPGRTLTDLLLESPGIRSATEAARIVLPLVEAIAHAHQNGVVHRDIKPANVILDARTKQNGFPFCPKLTDFGAARMVGTDQSITASGMLIGTVPYMAPEQITGGNVGPACDVYALGVLLYELTSGQLPIQGSDSADTLHKVVSFEPVPLRRLLPEASRDFSAICSRCLEKDPAKRYASAAHLADDLRRFLNGEPTAARPLGPASRLFRWSRRNPLPLTMLTTICLIFALISGGLAWHTSRLRNVNQRLAVSTLEALRMRDRAEESELRAQQLQYVSAIRLAAKLRRDGDLRGVREVLASLEPKNEKRDLRGVEWYFLERAIRHEVDTLADYGAPVYFIRLSPDGESFVTAGEDGVIRLHDRTTGELRQAIASEQGEVNSVAYSPDTTVLASAGDDGSIRLWRASDGRAMERFDAHVGMVFGVEFTPDGQSLISCGADNTVNVWNSGQMEASYQDHTSRVEAIAVSPNGRWLASVSKDRSLVVRDLQSGEIHFRWDKGLGTLSSVAFSPDSEKVAAVEASGETKRLRMFDVASGTMILERPHSDGIRAVAFSLAGNHVLTTDNKGTARVWHVSGESESAAATQPQIIRQAHTSRAYSGVFEPGGASILTVGQDGRVCRSYVDDSPAECILDISDLEATTGREESDLALHSIAFHPNDQDLLAASPSGVWFLDVEGKTPPELLTPKGDNNWQCIAKPLEGTSVVVAGSTPRHATTAGQRVPALVWRLETDSGVMSQLLQTRSNSNINDVAYSPEGDMVAVVVAPHGVDDIPKRLLLLDAETGRQLREFSAAMGTKPRFTPDGRALVYGVQRDLHYVDLNTDEHRVVRDAHPESHDGISVSDDGRWLATCSDNRDLRIWSLGTLEQYALLQGHQGKITALQFSPDSRTLFSSSFDGTVKVWSIAARQHLLDLHIGEEGINGMALSQDGKRLAILEDKRRIRVYTLGHEGHDFGSLSEVH